MTKFPSIYEALRALPGYRKVEARIAASTRFAEVLDLPSADGTIVCLSPFYPQVDGERTFDARLVSEYRVTLGSGGQVLFTFGHGGWSMS